MRFAHTTRLPLVRIAMLLAILLGAGTAAELFAQDLKSGEQVYKETCFACHASGVEKARSLETGKPGSL